MNMSQKRSRTNRSTVNGRIILSLASGERTFYDFSKKEKVAAPATILKVLKELGALGFIERGKTEARGRQPYRLTWRGLVHVLSINEVYVKIDDVAEEYVDYMPFIFGKWELFNRAGLRDLLIKRFQQNMEAMELASRALGQYREWDMSKRFGLTPNELTFDLICPWMGLTLDLSKLKEHKHKIGELEMMEKMRSFVLRDKDLRAFVDEELYERMQAHMRAITYLEDWRANWWGFKKTV